MKKFMVVCSADGESWADFYDKAGDADNARMNCVCGLGGVAEVYERVEDPVCGPEYRFSWS